MVAMEEGEEDEVRERAGDNSQLMKLKQERDRAVIWSMNTSFWFKMALKSLTEVVEYTKGSSREYKILQGERHQI